MGRLLKDIWDLVDGPKPSRVKKRSKLLAFFWRGLGVVLLLFLVAADLSPRPVLFTPELSFEVAQQMEEAETVCNAVSENFSESSCGAEVWKACHIAGRSIEISGETPTRSQSDALRYLCDAAVVADTAELAMALAHRYGNQYYKEGWHKTTRTDEGEASFLLFQNLVDLEVHLLYESFNNRSNLADYVVTWPRLHGNSEDYPRYYIRSKDTVKKLLALRSSIKYFFRPYRNFGSYYIGDLEVVGITEDLDIWELGDNLWKEPSSAVYTKGDPERSCGEARTAARENLPGWDRLLDRCLRMAEICEERADRFSVSCSLAKGAAEFEAMWQKLPEVCALNDESADEPTNAEASIGDACNRAALAICQHQNVSPEDKWLGQLISMRDFACAAASRTPRLLFVKTDDSYKALLK